MTDSNLQNTVPEGAFGIGSKKTDDFTKNEKLKNTGIKDVPKIILDSLKNQTGATVLPQQITEKAIEKATIDGEELFIPLDENNRHYEEILKQVEAGTLTIKDVE